MVDAVVSFVVERLGDFLIQEAVFFYGIRNEGQLLKDELEWMQCFIKDAEEKEVDDAIIRKWISDIKDVAYDIEDVLDKFILKIHGGRPPNMLEEDDGGTLGRRPGLFASIKKCSCISNQNSSPKRSSLYSEVKEKVDLYGIGKDIEALRQRINNLSRKRELYRLEDIRNKQDGKSNTLGRLKQLRRSTSFNVEENVIGFEDDANKLLAKLIEQDPRRTVISILGMGGLGKTTLAKKLYHDVKNNFDSCAWVSVSQDYIAHDLLLRIIESFKIKIRGEEIEKMKKMNPKLEPEEILERYLHDSLKGTSYLLVIDDVWQKEAWESLKRALPDNKNGSRVIITTRIKEVAQRTDERTHVYQLPFLRPNESWKLFCEKAFQNSADADEGLKKLGREMVEKCHGLPLAIVVLGGLLSTKKPQEWRVVHKHIWRHLRNDSIHISFLLALSFNDLSYQLKLCFLYLGLFPEDYEIDMAQLIQLLVAEGLVQEDEDQLLEDVAENNLNELINRSLVQIEKKCWGRVATCRVHDLLRDLAIEKAKVLNFISICDEIKLSAPPSIGSSCRRHAIYSGKNRCFWVRCSNPLSRSLLFFNQQCDEAFKICSTLHLTPLCTRFILLRVLKVEGLVIESRSLPKEIGRLIHLKYLGLRNAYINVFPPSIVNLQRLQTLDLYGSECFITLPILAGNLQQLRHLIGNFTGPLPIDKLTNLLTLKYVCFGSWTEFNPERLVNLRELHIRMGYGEGKKFSLDSVAKLRSLRILSVRLENGHSFTSLQPLGHCPYLLELKLKGKLKNLPRDMDKLFPNLECLKLSGSLLRDDPMPSLEKLPNLMILDLGVSSYYGRKIICAAKGFPRLEILQLDLHELKEWQVGEDSMPMLRGLSIKGSSDFRIPERLRSIPLPGKWEFKDDDDNFFEVPPGLAVYED